MCHLSWSLLLLKYLMNWESAIPNKMQSPTCLMESALAHKQARCGPQAAHPISVGAATVASEGMEDEALMPLILFVRPPISIVQLNEFLRSERL